MAAIEQKVEEAFIASWRTSVNSSSKLSFYSTVNNEFTWEAHLDHARSFRDRRATSQIRCSSHKMNVESGRYKHLNRSERTCGHCSSLGVPNPPIEDENHVLHSCPLAADLREQFVIKYKKLTLKKPSTNFAGIYLEDAPSKGGRNSPTRQMLSREEMLSIHLSTRLMNNIYSMMLRRKKELKINPESN